MQRLRGKLYFSSSFFNIYNSLTYLTYFIFNISIARNLLYVKFYASLYKRNYCYYKAILLREDCQVLISHVYAYIVFFFLYVKDEPNVDEINAWLLQVEEKLNKLDAVPIDQLTEHHFEQCKVT